MRKISQFVDTADLLDTEVIEFCTVLCRSSSSRIEIGLSYFQVHINIK